MATIIKRKKSYSVVYNYLDESGKNRQKWETWHTHKEALKRKAEIENGQQNGTFCRPTNQTIGAFMYDFIIMYGENKWGVSTYDSNTGLIANYVNPLIGNLPIQSFNAREADKYIQLLRKTPPVTTAWRKPKTRQLQKGLLPILLNCCVALLPKQFAGISLEKILLTMFLFQNLNIASERYGQQR